MRTAVRRLLDTMRGSLAPRLAAGLMIAVPWSASTSIAHGGPDAQDAASGAPPSVIELFTSQGCPKCPPADRLVAELAKQPNTIAVTYPVSLWDFEGWKDTLASSAFTQRQRDYSKARGDRRIFTPQAIIDGVGVEAGSDRDSIARDAAAIGLQGDVLSVPMTVSENGGRLVIDIAARGTAVKDIAGKDIAGKGIAGKSGGDPAGVYVLRVAREKVVDIDRGQNSGRKIIYTNVVRAIAHVGDWTGDAWHFELPELEEPGDGYVVLLQRGEPGRPGSILAARKTANL